MNDPRPRHYRPAGCGIAATLVCDYAPWAAALFMEQALHQSLRGFGVVANLNDLVENVASLVDGAPQISSLAVDRDDNLVAMSDVARPGFRISGCGEAGSSRARDQRCLLPVAIEVWRDGDLRRQAV